MYNTTSVKSYGTPLAIILAGALLMLAAAFFALDTRPAHAQTVVFTSQMDIGSTGAQVSALQQYLAQSPSIYPQGLVTGYYGTLTAAAVTNFQNAYGIDPVGRVGPVTLAKLNQLESSGAGLGVGAPSLSNVSVTSVTGSSATVNWNTNDSTTGRVYYSTSPLAVTEAPVGQMTPTIGGNVASSATTGTSQSVTLSGLAPNTTYFYMLESTDASGNVSVSWPQGSFTTTSS